MIRRVGVVGCGLMGSGLAAVCARNGAEVTVVASTESGLERGRERVARLLGRAAAKGELSGSEVDSITAGMVWGTDLKLLRDSQLVVEMVPETLPGKLEVLGVLDAVVEDEDAVLASGTSSIPIMRLAGATANPGRVLGLHFFNPVHVMPLVELIGSLHTEQAALDRARTYVTDVLGKQVIHSQDRPGFVVNALLVPYLLAAVRMVQAGTASAEDVDKAMTLGCGHPMGPLALIDMIGLDTIVSIGEALYAEHRESHYAPPSLLRRMTEAGLLGRKSGRGFYGY